MNGDGRNGKEGVRLQAYAQSDVGRTREHNEDAYIVADLGTGEPLRFDSLVERDADERGMLFMVADGMGGAAAGEIASATAVDVVLRYLREHWSPRQVDEPKAFARTLSRATEVANAAIFGYAIDHPELRGMGTTATIAVLFRDTIYVSQVGDSRAYLIRQGVASQITKDQSLMQKLIEAGEISAEEAEQSERRNIILQALGPEAVVKIDLTHQQVRRGDVLILCSDGLSGLVKPETIAHVVEEEKDLARVCSRLIEMANELGGPDNITVVAARFEGEALAVASANDEIGHQRFPLGYPTPSEVRPAGATTGEVTPVEVTPVDVKPVTLPAVDEERRKRGELYGRILAGAGLLIAAWVAWRFFT